MHKIIFSTIFFVLILTGEFHAQESKIDSLKNLLPKSYGIEKVDLLNRIADLIKNSDVKNKEKYSTEALNEAVKFNYIYGIAEAQTNLGSILTDSEKYSKGMKYLKSAYKIFSNLGHEQQIGKVFHFMGKNYDYRGEIDSAILFYKKSLEIREKYNEQLNSAQLHTNLGFQLWSLGRFMDALNYFQKGLKIREQNKNDELIANSNNAIGSTYFKLGNFSKAMEYIKKSMLYREKSNDSLGKVISWNNIGAIYQKLGFYENAERYFKLSNDWADKTKYKFGKAYSLYNFGLLNLDKNKLKKSFYYFNESFLIAKTMYSQNIRTMILNYQGLIYEKNKDFSRAEDYYRRGLSIAQKSKDRFSESVLYQSLSRIFLAQNQFDKAKEILDKGHKFAEENKVIELLKDNYEIYSKIYSHKHDKLKSLEYYKLFTEAKDELLYNSGDNLSNVLLKFEISRTESEKQLLKKQKQIIEKEKNYEKSFSAFILIVLSLVIILGIILFFQYAYRLKAAKIIEMQKKNFEILNAKLNDQNAQLSEMNRQKDKLFSLIAHDLKSPFQALLGHSEMLSSEIDSMNVEHIKESSNSINESGKKIFNLIHTLLDWARQQLGKIEFKPTDFEIHELLDDAVSLYQNILQAKHIKLSKNYTDKTSVYADKEMIKSVARNILSNAIKFSPSGGEIEIETKLASSEDEVIVSIKDSGEGMEAELVSKIFCIDFIDSKPGTNKETGTGLGLNLCKEFVEKNSGIIFAESKLGIGSKFSFTLPLAKK